MSELSKKDLQAIVIANFKRVQGYFKGFRRIFKSFYYTLESASLRDSATMHIFWKKSLFKV
ncbi:hypothetical protein AGMMS49936_08410 [Endomicrobiia bacterium]|nr:hypothetical protein AGMMS49936_07220 [Endomicrobiia bacterium]GHT47519.1 hypothetical protein AGMMS49936_08410 [Endomicrobiia bacterium]